MRSLKHHASTQQPGDIRPLQQPISRQAAQKQNTFSRAWNQQQYQATGTNTCSTQTFLHNEVLQGLTLSICLFGKSAIACVLVGWFRRSSLASRRAISKIQNTVRPHTTNCFRMEMTMKQAPLANKKKVNDGDSGSLAWIGLWLGGMFFGQEMVGIRPKMPLTVPSYG